LEESHNVYITHTQESTYIKIVETVSYSANMHSDLYPLSQKTSPFYILNNSLKTESILIIFNVQYPDEISRQKIVNSPISPE